jgi:6-pyruvoyltetrahydropterin/6-carboxytetrahydropterin synthase
MYRLQVKTHFDAAHRLVDYNGKCNRLHGHRWDVEVGVQGPTLDDRNMLVD